jgi:hypothetical protein
LQWRRNLIWRITFDPEQSNIRGQPTSDRNVDQEAHKQGAKDDAALVQGKSARHLPDQIDAWIFTHHPGSHEKRSQ